MHGGAIDDLRLACSMRGAIELPLYTINLKNAWCNLID